MKHLCHARQTSMILFSIYIATQSVYTMYNIYIKLFVSLLGGHHSSGMEAWILVFASRLSDC